MPVKIDPIITEELQAMDLVLWECKHPKQPFFNEKTGKQSSREDKGWVIVSLAGPRAPEAPGGGPTLRAAVDAALRHSGLAERVPGLRGALMRLDKAVFDLWRLMREQAYDRGEEDDDIPF